MNNRTKLTVDQAIAEGYIFCSEDNSDGELIKIKECPFAGNYSIVDKISRPFQISDDCIAGLLDDYLCDQDEVADETGKLNDTAAAANFKPLTDEINTLLEKHKYYWPTDIKLIPNEK